MTDKKLTTLFTDNPITIDPGDLLYAVENTGTTPASGAFKVAQVALTMYLISVTVASNNITVKVTHLDGADPSADRPLYFKIGNAFYPVTAALSVTKNAGTNWCGSGSAILAAQEVDYCVYVGRNATDGVTIGFSRIFHARVYSDFSATSTNEKYAAISTITNAVAADPYVAIGRFAATLSAGAGYTWSVPTFTATNLIHRPIFETRWLTANYSATNFALGSTGTSSVKYRLIYSMFYYELAVTLGGTGISVGASPHMTLPFTTGFSGTSVLAGVANCVDASPAGSYALQPLSAGAELYPVALKSDGTYLTQAFLSNTIPFTWATGDSLGCYGNYPIG